MSHICIVLATYNGERFLKEMLQSLEIQTRPADKIIAIDDASQDSSIKILESFKDTLPLEIFKQAKNGGHCKAFATGLEYARQFTQPGDLIALADQDDVWKKDKLEKLEKEIGEYPLIFGDAEIIDKDGKIIHDSWRKQALIQKSIPLKAQIAGINNVTGCLSLFKVELLDKILPIPEGVTVHDCWIAMIAERNGGIKAIDDAVVQYRLHDSNAVGGRPAPAMSKTLAIQERWLQMILANTERLALTPDEIHFTKHLLTLTQKRLHKNFLPSEIPWIFANKNVLFNKVKTFALIKKIFFTAIGLPLAKRIWKKS
ncbi:glycosyltransferase [uncultured Fibrobacter sp.]|uniref:glycosyltransferase n=1 Tax=uncultured Fibrobacter sp. TaxID=261512 RepID=UPI00260E87A5|nr:glycosyltransferase [uncultured Fibrobacter sp.]